jgi:tetratricopeptide (TPR) repeat protein
MKSLAIKTLLAVSVLLCTQQSARATNANTYVADGERLYANGDYIKALSCFESSVTLDPDNAEGHYGLANVLLKLQKTQDAISEYQQAQSLSPKGQIGEYSKRALSALSGKTGQNSDGGTQQLSPQSGSTSAAAGSAQTDSQKAAILAEGKARAAEIRAQADREIAALKQEMQSSLLDTTAYLSAKGSRAGAQYFNNDVKSDFTARISSINSNAQRRIDETLKASQQRADSYP